MCRLVVWSRGVATQQPFACPAFSAAFRAEMSLTVSSRERCEACRCREPGAQPATVRRSPSSFRPGAIRGRQSCSDQAQQAEMALPTGNRFQAVALAGGETAAAPLIFPANGTAAVPNTEMQPKPRATEPSRQIARQSNHRARFAVVNHALTRHNRPKWRSQLAIDFRPSPLIAVRQPQHRPRTKRTAPRLPLKQHHGP